MLVLCKIGYQKYSNKLSMKALEVWNILYQNSKLIDIDSIFNQVKDWNKWNAREPKGTQGNIRFSIEVLVETEKRSKDS